MVRNFRPRRWAHIVALILVAATIAACGTTLDEAELQAANDSLQEARLAGGGAGGGNAASGATAAGGGSGEGFSVGGGAPGSQSGIAGVDGAGSGGASGSDGGDGSSGGGSGVAPSGAEVVLGSFGTGSGPIGAQLATIPVAVRAWSADVNARGGLGGRPVRIVSADDGGDPTRAAAIARRMVEEDRVVAFFGTYGATTIQAVIPYLEEVRIPLIGAENGNPLEDVSPMVFSPQLGADIGNGRALLQALVTQAPQRKLALLSCTESQTCVGAVGRIREYAPTVGVEIVYEARVSLAQPDYTAEMLAARNAGADAAAVYIDVASMVRVIRSAHRQGYFPQFVGGVSLNEEGFKAGGDDVEGTLAPSATAPYATSPLMEPYHRAVRQYVPNGGVGGTGASAWVSGKLVERIFEDIGGEVTSEAIIAALLGLRDEDLGGLIPPITFNDGPHGLVNLCSVPLRFENGGFVERPGGFVCAY